MDNRSAVLQMRDGRLGSSTALSDSLVLRSSELSRRRWAERDSAVWAAGAASQKGQLGCLPPRSRRSATPGAPGAAGTKGLSYGVS